MPLDSWPPVDYTNEIKTKPSTVWKTLLALHNVGGLSEYLFLEQLNSTASLLKSTDDVPSKRIAHNLWRSKLPDVLFDIALEESMYTNADTELNNIYKTHVFQLFHWYLVYLVSSKKEQGMKIQIEKTLRSFSKIWSLIWKHRETFFHWTGVDTSLRPRNAESAQKKFTSYFCEVIADVVRDSVDLEKDIFNRWPDYECRVRQVLLYIWQYSKNKNARDQSTNILDWINFDMQGEEIDDYIFNDYLPTEDDIGRFMDRLEQSLMYPLDEFSFTSDYTDDEGLWLANHVLEAPRLRKYMKTHRKAAQIKAVCFALRRNACRYGDGLEDIQRTHRGFWQGFEWFSKVLHFDDDDRGDAHVRLGIPLVSFQEYQLVPIAVRALINYVASEEFTESDYIDEDYLNTIYHMFQEQQELWREEEELPEDDPQKQDIEIYRDHFRPLWISTLQTLRNMSRNSSPSILPMLSSWIKRWLRHGHNLGINESDFSPPTRIKIFSDRRGCHWQECMCHGLEECHKMRVCKGCSRVLYCSENCQRRETQDPMQGVESTQ
ncbi:hypothetical protein ABKN59_011095 [Abortiporus biennis]